MLNVIHGGFIRYSAKVSSGESTLWSKGQVLTVNTSGQYAMSAGTGIQGIALEDRKSATSVGPTVTVTKVGDPAGEVRSTILDLAVLQTDQLASGSVFVAGDTVYVSSTGKLADVTQKAGSSVKAGIALSDGHAGDSARPLTLLFKTEY